MCVGARALAPAVDSDWQADSRCAGGELRNATAQRENSTSDPGVSQRTAVEAPRLRPQPTKRGRATGGHFFTRSRRARARRSAGSTAAAVFSEQNLMISFRVHSMSRTIARTRPLEVMREMRRHGESGCRGSRAAPATCRRERAGHREIARQLEPRNVVIIRAACQGRPTSRRHLRDAAIRAEGAVPGAGNSTTRPSCTVEAHRLRRVVRMRSAAFTTAAPDPGVSSQIVKRLDASAAFSPGWFLIALDERLRAYLPRCGTAVARGQHREEREHPQHDDHSDRPSEETEFKARHPRAAVARHASANSKARLSLPLPLRARRAASVAARRSPRCSGKLLSKAGDTRFRFLGSLEFFAAVRRDRASVLREPVGPLRPRAPAPFSSSIRNGVTTSSHQTLAASLDLPRRSWSLPDCSRPRPARRSAHRPGSRTARRDAAPCPHAGERDGRGLRAGVVAFGELAAQHYLRPARVVVTSSSRCAAPRKIVQFRKSVPARAARKISPASLGPPSCHQHDHVSMRSRPPEVALAAKPLRQQREPESASGT